MAQLGMWKGVVDAGRLEEEGQEKVPAKTLTGVMAFLLWCVRLVTVVEITWPVCC